MRQITVIGSEGQVIPRGRIVVDPDGVRVWESRVRESKHLYKRMDAWTLSETIITQLRALGVERIRLIVTDRDGEAYEIALAQFIALAEELDQGDWKIRTEQQWALTRRFWERRESTVRQLALF